MPAPTNIDGPSAIELGPLPNTIVQDVRFGGTTYTVWYKYFAQPGDNVIGIWAYGGLGSYEPILEVSLQDDGTPLYLGILSHNRPVQIPVSSGNTYYFKVTTNSSSADPASLTISGLHAPDDEVPAGSIFINDDSNGFPLALLNGLTGVPLQFIQGIPAGEKAEILDDGRVLIHDNGNTGDFFFYSADFTTILFQHTLALFPIVNDPPISTNRTDTFYIGSGNVAFARVTTLDTDGNEGTLIGPLDTLTLRGISPSPDESILYYTSTSGLTIVRRWSITTNLALSDLAPDEVGYGFGIDIIVLADGSIIVPYNKDDQTAHYCKRYNAAGTLLNTYTLDADEEINIIKRGVDDTSFWIWVYPSSLNGVSRFIEIRVSDGTELHNFDAVQFELGIYEGDETATPVRFGHSFSCPFLILRGSSPIPPTPAPNASSGIYFIDPGKTNDTLWIEFNPDVKRTVKIP